MKAGLVRVAAVFGSLALMASCNDDGSVVGSGDAAAGASGDAGPSGGTGGSPASHQGGGGSGAVAGNGSGAIGGEGAIGGRAGAGGAGGIAQAGAGGSGGMAAAAGAGAAGGSVDAGSDGAPPTLDASTGGSAGAGADAGLDAGADVEDGGCWATVLGCVGSGEIAIGAGAFPLPGESPIVEGEGLRLDGNGDLTIGIETNTDHFVWTANDAEGTVSKLDTVTGAELARYASVTRDPNRVVNHVSRSIAGWDDGGGGSGIGYADNRPSRTAIDAAGNLWVANRAHDGGNSQPSVTKIQNDVDVCADRNGNGTIDTSREVNGISGIQLTDASEFLGEADECIALTVVIGALGGRAEALAVDAADHVWVGMGGEQAFYQLDGATGALMQRVATSGFSPFGAAVDGAGRLWTTAPAAVGQIDAPSNPALWTPISRPASILGAGYHGIAVDDSDRIWLGGAPYGIVQVYDPTTNVWSDAAITGYPTMPARGVALDGRGNVWATLHPVPSTSAGRVARISATTLTNTGTWDVGGTTPLGVDIDANGNIWTINQASSNASRLHVDEVTGEPAPHPLTGNVIDIFPVGRLPEAYSDFVGAGERMVSRLDGELRLRIEGCDAGVPASWNELEWDIDSPVGTAFAVTVQAADDLGTLPIQPSIGPWPQTPADLGSAPGPVPDARYLLVSLRLSSLTRDLSPTVRSFGVRWTCP